MKARRLGWSIAWRLPAWGVLGGAALGAVYAPIALVIQSIFTQQSASGSGISSMWLTIFLLEGMIYGGFVGLLVGICETLALGIAAIFFHVSFNGTPENNRKVQLISSLVGGLGVLLICMFSDRVLVLVIKDVGTTLFQHVVSLSGFYGLLRLGC